MATAWQFKGKRQGKISIHAYKSLPFINIHARIKFNIHPNHSWRLRNLYIFMPE